MAAANPPHSAARWRSTLETIRMTYLSLTARAALVVAVITCAAFTTAQAQDKDAAQDSSWYSDEPTTVQVTPRMIIQQKAQARAYQRMARIESMKWYGMSASRPQASTTPFMGIPSPRWQSSPGTPFAWTPRRATNVYIVR